MKTLTNEELELIDIMLYSQDETIQSLCDAVLLNNLCGGLFDFHKYKSGESFERSESVYYTVRGFYFDLYKDELGLIYGIHHYLFGGEQEELFEKIKQYEGNEPYVIYFNKLFNYE